jgi:hypothetical protein
LKVGHSLYSDIVEYIPVVQPPTAPVTLALRAEGSSDLSMNFEHLADAVVSANVSQINGQAQAAGVQLIASRGNLNIRFSQSRGAGVVFSAGISIS